MCKKTSGGADEGESHFSCPTDESNGLLEPFFDEMTK
jgi:hypothetical protein